MPTPSDQVVIRVGELEHAGWTRYDIDSDLMVPADAWRVQLAQRELTLPANVVEGARVSVSVGGEPVLSGRIDERSLEVDKGRHVLQLSGRDDAGVLLDCSAPIVTVQRMTLAQVIQRIVEPLGIRRWRVDAAQAYSETLREKVSTEPCDTAWDALRRAAEANGLWPWMEPDGTLVVGGPDYDQAPVATLTLRGDGAGNNVLSLIEQRSIVHRYSSVTVLGQAQSQGVGAGQVDARSDVRATANGEVPVPGGSRRASRTLRDESVSLYRPLVVVDHEATTEAIALARARKVISDGRVKCYGLQALVVGHRTTGGVLWTPGQRVQVVSEPHGIDGAFFLMGRRFTADRANGPRTQLRLVEDRVWTLDAHPSRRKHRRGRNSLSGRIVDITGLVK